MRRKLRNMKEFSNVTGLSRPTVSRYFDDPDSVRASTRERIEAALQLYDYRPNFFAVNQNRRNPKTLGIVVPQITDPFFAEMVGLIESAAIAAGYFAITLGSHGSARDELQAIEMIRSLNLGAVILSPLGRVSDAGAIAQLNEDTPLLLFDTQIDGLDAPSLACDNAQGIGLMVDHLCETGPAPCYVDMPEVNSTARERREAFIAAMEARGLEPCVIPSPETGWALERIGAEIARTTLAGPGFPSTTIMCGNDRVAIGLLSVLYQEGLSVGPEGAFRVTGHDDHPAAGFSCPSLTTIAQDTVGLASRAVEITLEMIATGVPPRVSERRPSQLVLRASA